MPKAAAVARSVAEGSGGLVANEETERVDDTHEMSHLVLRVPQGEYDAVLKELAGTGKLLSRTSSAKDVTDQVVDVESRIATQRASVARVRKLMERAGKLSDVVTLEGELSSRQASWSRCSPSRRRWRTAPRSPRSPSTSRSRRRRRRTATTTPASWTRSPAAGMPS